MNQWDTTYWTILIDQGLTAVDPDVGVNYEYITKMCYAINPSSSDKYIFGVSQTVNLDKVKLYRVKHVNLN